MKKILLLIFISLNAYCQTAGNGVTDIDKKTYYTIIINNQEWMQQNLDVSHYRNGEVIPHVQDGNEWLNLKTGAWCYYNNDPTSKEVYGKLYNWYAINDPRGLSPVGWHVPNVSELKDLTTFLGGIEIAGGKMKDFGTTHWQSPNTNANNDSGFKGLPGGVRTDWWFNKGYSGSWWLSNEFDLTNAYAYGLGYVTAECYSGNDYKYHGRSVRCLIDFTLSNEEYESQMIKIYPNPTKEQITIDLGKIVSDIGWSIKIVNMLGQEIINMPLSSQQSVILLNSLSGKGIYFVNIYDASNNLKIIKKIILE
jgi:uncharacterized protein (TIGR02145 family)